MKEALDFIKVKNYAVINLNNMFQPFIITAWSDAVMFEELFVGRWSATQLRWKE